MRWYCLEWVIFFFIPSVNEFPVLKADAIKYVMTFRSQVSTFFSITWCAFHYTHVLHCVWWCGFCLVLQLPKEQLLEAVPLLVSHLQAESIVQHTYAAHALERLFTMRGANNTTLWVYPVQDMRRVVMLCFVIILISKLTLFFSITPTEMAPFTEQLLNNLFKALAIPGSSENEYIMKGNWLFNFHKTT